MRAADFIEETASSIAGTNGDGAITLAASGTRPRFSHPYPNGAYVRYSIEDTTTGKLETGIGYVASNVLTRTKVRTTWDGTTYTNKNATPLQFGSTPAAGKVFVRLTPTADTSSAGIQAFVSASFANMDATWTQYPLSGHLNSWPASQSIGIDNTTDYFSYYKLEIGGNLQGFQFEVTAAGAASSVIKSAIFELGADGLPGKKIIDFPDVDASTSGVKTLTNQTLWTPAENVYLSPGWYAIGLKCTSAASVSLRAAFNANSQIQMTTPLGKTNGYVGYKNLITRGNSYSTSAFPSVPDFTTGSPAISAVIHWLGLKVAP